jgi:hypothetical protein
MAGVGGGEREWHKGVEVPVGGQRGEDDSHKPSTFVPGK